MYVNYFRLCNISGGLHHENHLIPPATAFKSAMFSLPRLFESAISRYISNRAQCGRLNVNNERKIAFIENFNQTSRLKKTRQPWVRTRQPVLLIKEREITCLTDRLS